jgi:hypothetical protein
VADQPPGVDDQRDRDAAGAPIAADRPVLAAPIRESPAPQRELG